MLRELPDDEPRHVEAADRRRRRRRRQGARGRRRIATRADPSDHAREVIEAAEAAVVASGATPSSAASVACAAIRSSSRRRAPICVPSGQFPDANMFPKLVTVIDLTKVDGPARRSSRTGSSTSGRS